MLQPVQDRKPGKILLLSTLKKGKHMAISAKAPKDFSKISNKTKVALNLTKRQLICFGAAAFTGIPVYIATKKFLGTDIAAILHGCRCGNRDREPV